MLKDWKKTGSRDFWKHKNRATAIYITIIGNPAFGKVDTYAVVKINFYGAGSPYENTELLEKGFEKREEAIKYAKQYMKTH